MSHKQQSEQVSALIDAELSDQELDAVLAQLSDPALQSDWATYQQIGDILRSDDLAFQFSADFNQRLSARLAEEPGMIAAPKRTVTATLTQRYWWAGGGFAVAAMLSWLFLPVLQQQELAPQLAQQSGVNAINRVNPGAPTLARASATRADEVKTAAESGRNPEEMQILRDSRLDSYLMAHQRYSPSLNQSGAYVARANVTNAASAK